MKLYFSRGACSLAIRIVINEIGLKCDYESVDLATKKTQSGTNFLAVNPKGAVPTLELDNNVVLTENAVIMQYLADTTHATKLLPPVGDYKRYQVLEWVNYTSTEVHKGYSALFNPKMPQEIKDNFSMPNLNVKYNYLNKHLEHNKFLLGDDFTLPDAYLFVMLVWATKFKFNFAEWPHLSRYFNELQERKSIQKSIEQEDLTLAHV